MKGRRKVLNNKTKGRVLVAKRKHQITKSISTLLIKTQTVSLLMINIITLINEEINHDGNYLQQFK